MAEEKMCSDVGDTRSTRSLMKLSNSLAIKLSKGLFYFFFGLGLALIDFLPRNFGDVA
jgi:hypothetical protein